MACHSCPSSTIATWRRSPIPRIPGERLIVCRNPRLAEDRARKRRELLAAAERKIETIAAATRRPRRPLSGAARFSYRVGRALAASKVEKYLQWEMTSEGLVYRRDQTRIDRDAALDGIYVIRTSVAEVDLSADDTVGAYKRLAVVERAFRTLKSVDLLVRPIYHRNADRVRAHVFLCLLAYYVEWLMRRLLAPLLFDDEASDAATRPPVAPAARSATAIAKARAPQAHARRSPGSEFSRLAPGSVDDRQELRPPNQQDDSRLRSHHPTDSVAAARARTVRHLPLTQSDRGVV